MQLIAGYSLFRKEVRKTEKAIVCFSGGHSSALVAIETVKKYGKNNVILLNHNISSKVEHTDIKRFKQDVADYCDLDITYANADNFEEMTPLKVCLKKKTIVAGRPGMAICTSYLKTKPFYKYLEANPKSKDISILYGFDAEEPERINRRTDIIRAMGYTAEFPLADWDRTIENIEEIGIQKPITYKTFKHANCMGCLKAGRRHWYIVYCLRKDIFNEAMATEEQIGYSIIKDIYLKDLIPIYEDIISKGICPNEKGNDMTFWAKVNQSLPEQTSLFPCDCSF